MTGGATLADTASNPKHLTLPLLDFASQSRALPDLVGTVGYTKYYLSAGVPTSKQIFAPAAPDDFAQQLTLARSGCTAATSRS